MGEISGPFELRTRLGQTELGESFLARRDGAVCGVLKRFTAELTADASFRAALTAELTLAAQLKHPSIAAVLEQGELDGRAFVLHEYVEGSCLAQLIRAAKASSGWPLSMGRAVSLVAPVLEALSVAHALTPALLHRDLAPENVLLTSAGRVVVTDFGLGRARNRVGGASSLRRAYVSPEQARGLACDPRSEVFSVGLVLFELACGRLPAQGGPGEVISQIATGELDGPRVVNPALDEAACAVLTRALAPRPEDRFGSAQEFLGALAPWAAAGESETLAAWVSRLQQVTLEPLPPRVLGPARPAAKPAMPVVPPVAKIAPPVVAVGKSRRKLWIYGAAIAAVVVAGSISARLNSVEAPKPESRPLELTSIPSGATILVDGVQVGRTPLTLHFAKDEMRHLIVRKGGFNTWDGVVRNTSKLQLDLATGEADDERYDGERPGLRTPPTPEPAPRHTTADDLKNGVVIADEVRAQTGGVVFDVEAPPVSMVLTRRHSVRVDDTPSLDVPEGTELMLPAGSTVYQAPFSPTPGGRSTFGYGRPRSTASATQSQPVWRSLAMFGLRRVGTGVEVFDLRTPVQLVGAGVVHFFSPSDNGGDQLSGTPAVIVNKTRRTLGGGVLLRVSSEDSFLVRVLKPGVAYRLELSRADGTTEPIPAVVVSMRAASRNGGSPTGPTSTDLRFDGLPLESQQALVTEGAHIMKGASSVWFTIPTVEGVVPADVKLTLTAARVSLEAQRRQVQIEIHRAGEKPATNPQR